jgi:hypothetical protein
MSLRKFCTTSAPAVIGGRPTKSDALPSSPACEHHWFNDFRVNRKRYWTTTETANRQDAKKIEARDRSRVLEGRHHIRQQPDITFMAFGDE